VRRLACVPLLVVAALGPLACKDEPPPPSGPSAASTSVQAYSDYMQRSKAAEAKVNVARMFDAAASYFESEQLAPGQTALVVHQCPNDGSATGETGITPPLAVNCSKAPGGRCTAVAGEPKGPGEYSASLWRDSKVWSAMFFEQDVPHYFHYNFKWSNEANGAGKCQFTAQAFGDLDDDGVYSTYERVGTADPSGTTPVGQLRVENELE